jgi:large subunit ribosomal protein L31
MKADLHPKYFDCKVHCGCGNEFKTRATVKELRIEICSVCHPFYSGKQKFVDSAGRIDSFLRRYGADGKGGEGAGKKGAAQAAGAAAAAASAAKEATKTAKKKK